MTLNEQHILKAKRLARELISALKAVSGDLRDAKPVFMDWDAVENTESALDYAVEARDSIDLVEYKQAK